MVMTGTMLSSARGERHAEDARRAIRVPFAASVRAVNADRICGSKFALEIWFEIEIWSSFTAFLLLSPLFAHFLL